MSLDATSLKRQRYLIRPEMAILVGPFFSRPQFNFSGISGEISSCLEWTIVLELLAGTIEGAKNKNRTTKNLNFLFLGYLCYYV